MPQALKCCPKCNKLPNLVTLVKSDLFVLQSHLFNHCFVSGLGSLAVFLEQLLHRHQVRDHRLDPLDLHWHQRTVRSCQGN